MFQQLYDAVFCEILSFGLVQNILAQDYGGKSAFII